MEGPLTEIDGTGAVVATYVSSPAANGSARVDVIKPKDKAGSVGTRVLRVFLPAGYPHSVTADYMWYQIYDSLQAFSSAIAGLLSSRAVLQGVGVGDASASPTTALLLSVLQESTGRIATILFAHKLGTALEPDCKMYRLAADVFNDAAMILDCLSPALPKVPRVMLLSASSVLRALCGVAAGSSKASLSAHFAKWGNLGELNAKDSSQETVISLLGMLAGSVVVSYVSSPTATWSCLIVLLSIHLAMNHAAVRAVSMHSLNRQRANIVMSHFLADDQILTPDEVSNEERIFEWDGILRWKGSAPFAHAHIGTSLHHLLQAVAPAHDVTGAIRDTDLLLHKLLNMHSREDHILWYDLRNRAAYIVLKEHASPQAQLKAWTHSLWVAQRLRVHADATRATTDDDNVDDNNDDAIILGTLEAALRDLSRRWEDGLARMHDAGWDTQVAALETTMSGIRVRSRARTIDD